VVPFAIMAWKALPATAPAPAPAPGPRPGPVPWFLHSSLQEL
jgi:hypothetical protein